MPHKVLLVDDEPHVTEALKRGLRKEPYEVYVADSADEALQILARESIDIVVSDEMMPGMSGSEFQSIVSQKYPDTIRMILTGHASIDSVINSIHRAQVYCYLTKPCSGAALANFIREALEQKEHRVQN